MVGVGPKGDYSWPDLNLPLISGMFYNRLTTATSQPSLIALVPSKFKTSLSIKLFGIFLFKVLQCQGCKEAINMFPFKILRAGTVNKHRLEMGHETKTSDTPHPPKT